MEELRFSRTIGAAFMMTALLRALGRDAAIPSAVGLERDGAELIKPYCPPYYRTMEEAVLAFVDYKYAHCTGTFGMAGKPRAGRSLPRCKRAFPDTPTTPSPPPSPTATIYIDAMGASLPVAGHFALFWPIRPTASMRISITGSTGPGTLPDITHG
jgi:hypothetical protein